MDARAGAREPPVPGTPPRGLFSRKRRGAAGASARKACAPGRTRRRAVVHRGARDGLDRPGWGGHPSYRRREPRSGGARGPLHGPHPRSAPHAGQVPATGPVAPDYPYPVDADPGYLYWRPRPDGSLVLGGRRHLDVDTEATDVLVPSPRIQDARGPVAGRSRRRHGPVGGHHGVHAGPPAAGWPGGPWSLRDGRIQRSWGGHGGRGRRPVDPAALECPHFRSRWTLSASMPRPDPVASRCPLPPPPMRQRAAETAPRL